MSPEGTWGKAPLVGRSSLPRPRPAGAPSYVPPPAQPRLKEGTSCSPRAQSALCRVPEGHPPADPTGKGGTMWGAPSLMPRHVLPHEREGAVCAAGVVPKQELARAQCRLGAHPALAWGRVWQSCCVAQHWPGLMSVEAAGTWAPEAGGSDPQGQGKGSKAAGRGVPKPPHHPHHAGRVLWAALGGSPSPQCSPRAG